MRVNGQTTRELMRRRMDEESNADLVNRMMRVWALQSATSRTPAPSPRNGAGRGKQH
jgi:hypothetical protein